MKTAVEAVLFAAGRYVEEEYIGKVLQEDIRKVRKALAELKDDYDKRENCAIHVVQEGKQWKLTVRDEYLSIASKLVSDKEIATTVLETLAVVAWKNPIQQAELIKIRGPAAYEHIGDLVERGFVTKVPEGRSFKLTLQEKFFDYFDVSGREDLRKLFAPIEADAAVDQAEIDAKEAAYDAKVRQAQQAVSSENSGTSDLAASSEHSAQKLPQTPKDLISEIKAAAQKLNESSLPKEQTKPSEKEKMPVQMGSEQRVSGNNKTAQAVAEVEEAVQEFRREIKEIKQEMSDSQKTKNAKK